MERGEGVDWSRTADDSSCVAVSLWCGSLLTRAEGSWCPKVAGSPKIFFFFGGGGPAPGATKGSVTATIT